MYKQDFSLKKYKDWYVMKPNQPPNYQVLWICKKDMNMDFTLRSYSMISLVI